MTDQRPLLTTPRADDPFERELRALLRDRAAGNAPARLHETLTDVTRRAAPRPATGWRRPVVSLVAAAAAVLLLAMGFNPVSSWLQAVTVPAASPSPDRPVVAVRSPVVSPIAPAPTPAIDWDSGLVRLTADWMRLTTDGMTFTGIAPDVEVTGDPGGAGYRTLEARWTEQGHRGALYLYLRSDGTDWWLEPLGGETERSEVGGRVGEPWTGDIRMTAEDGSLEMGGVTLDAFAPETLPGSLLGCEPVAPPLPPETMSETSPLDPGQPLAGTGIESMTPADAKALLTARGLCHLFSYRNGDPARDGEAQRWCAAPPGAISELFYDSEGAVRIVVQGTEPFARPDSRSAFGPGCGEGASLPSASPSSAPTAASPTPAASAFAWNGAGVTFTADALAIAGGAGADRDPATLPAGVIPTRRRIAPGEVELRWEWKDDARMLLQATVRTDGVRWWVTELAVQDGTIDDTFRRWTDVPPAGRIGEAWSGDLELRPSDANPAPASLKATNLVFDPGVTTADLEAPPSPMPIADRPFSIDNGHVRLTADRFELSHRGEVIRGPVISGSVQPGTGTLVTNSLEASWFDDGRRVGLTLGFRNDGQRWWVTDGTISARGMSWAPLDLPQVGAAMGEAWAGDLDLRLPQMRLDGTSGPTGERLHLVIENLSIHPFRGTLPRTMTGCAPVVDTTRIDWRTDPTRRGQPLATKGILGLPAEKAAGVLEDLGYCYVFDRRLTPDPSLGPSGTLETWCDAPPGEVSGLRYGRGGEVHLIVLTQVPKGTPKRQQPVLGFGCQAGVSVPSDAPLPSPVARPSPAAVAPFTQKAHAWDTGTIRIAADDVSLAIGDQVIHPEPGTWGGAADDRDGRPQITIPIGDDAEARITFTSDGTSWSLYGAEIYADSIQGGAPLSTAGISAPLGAPFIGDLAITGTATGVPGGATVTLRLDGAEIAAYRPVVARTMRDCQMPAGIRARSDNPSLPGEPLDSLGLVGSPASMAADVMRRLGYCYTFSVITKPRRVADGIRIGGSETWCDTPDGTVKRAVYGETGEIWFEVEPSTPIGTRPQPPVGWGCLSDVPGYGPQQQEAP